MIFNMAGGGGGSGKGTLVVSAPGGSSVSCSKAGVVKTAQESGGVWTFRNLEPGVWTVTASLGGDTASKAVSVAAGATVTVTLEYTPYLYNRGDRCTDVTGGYEATGAGQVSFSADHMAITATKTQYSSGRVGTVNAIDLTDYDTLVMKAKISGAMQTYGKLGVSSDKEGDFAASVALSDSSGAEVVVNLDISQLTGSFYPAVQIGYGSSTVDRTVQVYELYLE